MTFKILDITNHLESIAPSIYQASYDNSRLLTGNAQDYAHKILVTLDCTEEVVDEAISKGCNLIVAHHPIIFSGLKSLTGANYIEKTIIKAIKNDIAIYACHTNLDSMSNGVNKKICDKLGLINTSILAPKENNLHKITVFVPCYDAEKVTVAMNQAGAGQIGNYKDCSFASKGTGSFTPNAVANPSIGSRNQKETVSEDRIEFIVPEHLVNKVITSMKAAHPYEEVAFYDEKLLNHQTEIGSGMIGELVSEMDWEDFCKYLKEKMNLQVVRHTKDTHIKIKKVAICGGSGSFLLKNAIKSKSEVYITSDFKYHEFFDAEDKIIIADIGHYESEVFTKELFLEFLSEKFANIAVVLSESNTNPILYS